MAKRASLNLDGAAHSVPIPTATRVGPLVMSSTITPRPGDPDGGTDPVDYVQQTRAIFRDVTRAIEGLGGSLDDIAKMNFFVPVREIRSSIDVVWLEVFPDEHSRPARHVIVYATPGDRIHADFMGFLGQ
jgi:2-iminobutanoate/2-iminopropanoate deaminase